MPLFDDVQDNSAQDVNSQDSGSQDYSQLQDSTPTPEQQAPRDDSTASMLGGAISGVAMGGQDQSSQPTYRNPSMNMLQSTNPPEGSPGHMNSIGMGFYAAQNAEKMRDPAYIKNMMDLQEQQGIRASASQGGINSTLNYLDRTDPAAATELRKKAQDYNNSVLDGVNKGYTNDSAQLKAQQDNMVFLGNMYSKAKQVAAEDPVKGAVFWQKLLPIARQHDPGAPDTFDPDRADIAISQAVTAQMTAKQDMDRQTAMQNAAIEVSKPQTDLAKQQQDVQNATARGDFKSANELSQQVQDTMFTKSQERLKASNGDADKLRGEYTDQSRGYINAREGYGQVQVGLSQGNSTGDKTALYGMMKLINPQIQLQPGQLATVTNAPGIEQRWIDDYNSMFGGGSQLDGPKRAELKQQADMLFQVKDTQQQQLDKRFGGLAASYGLDPKKVVSDQSPAASIYSPEQEDQLRRAPQAEIDNMLKQALADKDPQTGKPMTTPDQVQQMKAMIDKVRRGQDGLNHPAVQQIKQQMFNDMQKLNPKADPNVIKGLSDNSEILLKYGINTPARVQQFMAQAAHETRGFGTLTEDASGKAYEGRNGNRAPGDGALYKGRGPLQLTSRGNYEDIGNKIGVNLVAHPQLAADPKIGLEASAAYWQMHGLNQLADKGDIREISRRIQGTTATVGERQAYLTRIQKAGLFKGELPNAPQGDQQSPTTQTQGQTAWQPAFKGMGMPGPDHNGQPTSLVGMERGRLHAGNDFYTPIGTPLQAQADGKVMYKVANTGVGNYGHTVVIQYNNGKTVQYSHLTPGSSTVDVGDSVKAGQLFAKSGASGTKAGQGESGEGVTPPHVHVEMVDNKYYKGGYIGGVNSPSRSHVLQAYREFGFRPKQYASNGQ